jgi:hypothetical protein
MVPMEFWWSRGGVRIGGVDYVQVIVNSEHVVVEYE